MIGRMDHVPETIRSRYVATLLTRFVQLVLGFVTATMVPRVLGAVVYGNYNFLLNMATVLRAFIEPSVQEAFFTFSSQQERTGPLTRLYGGWLFVQLVLTLTFIGVMAAVGLTPWLWPGQSADQIVWITLVDWAVFLGVALQQLGDSKGLTVRAQVIGAVVSVVNLVGLLVLMAAGVLNFYTYVWVNLGSAMALCGVLGYWLLVLNQELCWAGAVRERGREYLRRWWRYSAPLILLGFYMPLQLFLSTYLLQSLYGSIEQAYFALATRWSTLVMVFTGAMLMIYWREIASSVAAGNRARAAQIYSRVSRLLFFLALVLCFWLSLSSPKLVEALAGEEYRGAVPVVMVMAFYPVAQTLGQLSVAALKAVERTAHYRNLSLVLSVPDLLLTYLLLVPPTAVVPGLGLGAIGVAWRLMGYGLVSVQVFDWSNFRFFGLDYRKALLDRLIAVGIVGACALLTVGVLAGRLEVWWSFNVGLSLVVASMLYFLLIGVVVLTWPGVAGISRAEILSNLRFLLGRVVTPSAG